VSDSRRSCESSPRVLLQSRTDCARRFAVEALVRDVRVFGGVWYDILASSGGIPHRLP
jgi:hypothetical protein